MVVAESAFALVEIYRKRKIPTCPGYRLPWNYQRDGRLFPLGSEVIFDHGDGNTHTLTERTAGMRFK
jgi:hypothetical protein